MKLMLTYAMPYGSSLAEVLTSKLTAFYNKIILQESTKLIMLLPSDTQLSKAELHKAMFNEITVAQFDPTNAQFWKCKNLYKFLYFINSTANLEYNNIYIDYGKVFKTMPPVEDADILVANIGDDANLVRYINKQLHDHCDLPLLDDNQIVLYDFSAFYVSDNARVTISTLLKQVVEAYPEYVDTDSAYAILSCLVAHAQQQNQYKIETLNQNSINIANTGLVEDFYTIV